MLAGSLGKGDVPNVRTERHKENKTHNIQPQHAHGGTRVSGSFSNWSVSGDSYSGTSERVVVVR